MSKRIVICVPDAYVNMVERFMSAQAHKGLSFSVLIAMAMKSYGATDIIGPALMGSGLSSISASHLASLSSGGLDASAPKRRRGRPRKSENNFVQKEASAEANTEQTKLVEPKVSEAALEAKHEPSVAVATKHKEPASTSSYEPFAEDPYAKAQENVPNTSKRENTFESRSDFEEKPAFVPTSTKDPGKERSGWSDDAFDGIDPDFNPDGGIDNVFELLQNS